MNRYELAPHCVRQAAMCIDAGIAHARPELVDDARIDIVETIFSDLAAVGLTLVLVEHEGAWQPKFRHCRACGSGHVAMFCANCGADQR